MKYVQVVKEWNFGKERKIKDYDFDIEITAAGLKTILTDELAWHRTGSCNILSGVPEKYPDLQMKIVSHQGFSQSEIDSINFFFRKFIKKRDRTNPTSSYS